MKNEQKSTAHTKIKINNMVCTSCETLIEKSVRKKDGIENIKVDYVNGYAKVTYDPKKVTLEGIKEKIKEAGYPVEEPEEEQKNGNKKTKYFAFGIILLIILIIAYVTLSPILYEMNISIPQIDAGTSAIIIFFVGLLTGFHCIGMCGGFILSYTAEVRAKNPKSLNLGAHVQYAAGKTVSYTIIGGIFGIIGSIFVFSPTLRATIAVLAGIFLILFGLKILNVPPILRRLSIPQSAFNIFKIGPLKKNSNPLAIGLANGLFIACGPLQAMYILAMTTGSFIGGAMILFAFGIGTLIPLLGFGVFASFISRGIQHNIVKISALIVIVMGLLMINNGIVLTGNSVTTFFTTPNLSVNNQTTGNNSGNGGLTQITQAGTQGGLSNGPGYQIINMDVTSAGFVPNTFVLKTGVPVKWIINGKELNGCNSGIIVPAYNLDFKVKSGIQTIEFTPTKAGTINWSCWMGMIQANFIVRDDVSIDSTGKVTTSPTVQEQINTASAAAPKKSGGCGCGMKTA
ncbi:MAG: sulfite exporter TauE/SafE family protein [Candidatus Diapherotrites archaeon]|nr:sulfite exporter TauE/SafE family protein [Candidatus Diapherotrites archaeon]